MKVGRTIPVLLVSFVGAVTLWAQQPTPPPPAAQKMEMPGKPGMMDEKMMEEPMMAHHKEMMAKMEAMDFRLDDLVKKMNAAKGSKKADSVAAVAEIAGCGVFRTAEHEDVVAHVGIQLRERVVQQKDRCSARRVSHRQDLGQTQCQRSESLLAARSECARVDTVDLDRPGGDLLKAGDHPDWSPDGKYIVWTALSWNSHDGGNGKSDVRVARFDQDHRFRRNSPSN